MNDQNQHNDDLQAAERPDVPPAPPTAETDPARELPPAPPKEPRSEGPQKPYRPAPPPSPTSPPRATVPPAPPATVPPGQLQRSPGAALVLSFMPGLGHIYLGLYQRGVVLFTLFASAILLADSVDAAGILIPFIWFFGIIDAYRQAKIINLGGIETPSTTGQTSLGFGVFLTVLGAVLLINNFYDLDLSWLRDWWPAGIILVGLWLIASAWHERKKREAEKAAAEAEDVEF